MKINLELMKEPMLSQLLDMELRMVLNTGLEEILGEKDGEKMDSLELSEELTTLTLKLIELLEYLLIPGRIKKSILQQMRKEMIQGIIILMETLFQTQMINQNIVIVLSPIFGKVIKRLMFLKMFLISKSLNSQKLLIGEIIME